MTSEAFHPACKSVLVCLSGVELPQVRILGEGPSALVEHSELPDI